MQPGRTTQRPTQRVRRVLYYIHCINKHLHLFNTHAHTHTVRPININKAHLDTAGRQQHQHTHTAATNRRPQQIQRTHACDDRDDRDDRSKTLRLSKYMRGDREFERARLFTQQQHIRQQSFAHGNVHTHKHTRKQANYNCASVEFVYKHTTRQQLLIKNSYTFTLAPGKS